MLEEARKFIRDFPESGFARLTLFKEQLREKIKKSVSLDIEVLPKDKPGQLAIGWKVWEKEGLAMVNMPPLFPLYDQPRTPQFSHVPCPICNRAGCYITGHSTTLVGWFDEGDHIHDPNTHSASVLCQAGHTFSYTYAEECPVESCTYGQGSLRFTDVDFSQTEQPDVITMAADSFVAKTNAQEDVRVMVELNNPNDLQHQAGEVIDV